MFTGLVEEVGILKEITDEGLGKKFTINAKLILDDLKTGDSIAINGVCLTTVELDKNYFCVEVIEETLKKSDLGELEIGDYLNLERPLKADARLGGHFVLGHVDTTGKIININSLSNSHYITISFSSEYSKYIIPVGSIAIDGVSMTVADIKEDCFSVGIIPHTWDNTIFSKKKIGNLVNLEFDVLGKYILNLSEKNKD